MAVSFTAGLLSFLSPCVLPLVPSYVTFVTGMSLEDVQRSRRVALVHALLSPRSELHDLWEEKGGLDAWGDRIDELLSRLE